MLSADEEKLLGRNLRNLLSIFVLQNAVKKNTRGEEKEKKEKKITQKKPKKEKKECASPTFVYCIILYPYL